MRTNLRTQFDGGANYYKLLELARMIESENFHEDSKQENKPNNQKGKTKVGSVTVDNTAHQIQQLQGAAKGLTKLIQGNKQYAQPQQIPQFAPNPIQNNYNPILQVSQNQNPANPQGGRGGRGGYRGRGRGGLILCYWCRDFLPKEQANHMVANCPYQGQARGDWWKSQLSNIQGNPSNPDTEDKENCCELKMDTEKSAGEVPVDSPQNSKPLKEQIKQMLGLEKDSTKKEEKEQSICVQFKSQSEKREKTIQLY